MEIGNNGFDDIDELDDFTLQDSNPSLNDINNQNDPNNTEEVLENNLDNTENSFISDLLKSRGIEDMSKIKFENEEGSVEEIDWNNLSNEDKLNILNSSENEPETGLDDSEIQLINAIRDSKMTPTEFVQFIGNQSVDLYIKNTQELTKQYSVDQYSDDELFMADFISRVGDVTEELAKEALEQAKTDEDLFKRLIGAIRKEYKTIEDENIKQQQIEEDLKQQEEFNAFSQSVVDQLNNFKEFSGYDLNLDNNDMQTIYDFITGTDAAGNNHFAKALSDPKTLVQNAWFALNGERMISDITDYFQKEIAQVRKNSYEKGLADAKGKKDNNIVTYKNKQTKSQLYADDLDDFI